MSNKYAIASYVNIIAAWKPRSDFQEPGPNQTQAMLPTQLRAAVNSCQVVTTQKIPQETLTAWDTCSYLNSMKVGQHTPSETGKTQSEVMGLHHTGNRADGPSWPISTGPTDTVSLTACFIYQLVLHLGSKFSGPKRFLSVYLLEHLPQCYSGSRLSLLDTTRNNH